jgi:signal transduction histidine kinase
MTAAMQNPEPKSELVQSDIEKIDALNARAEDLLTAQPERSKSLAEEAETLARPLDYKKGLIQSLKIRGQVELYYSNFATARQLYEQLVTLCQEAGDKNRMAEAFEKLGMVSYHLADYAQALSYQTESLLMFQELGDRNGEAGVLGNMGIVYERLADYAEALSCHRQSMQHFEDLKDLAGLARTLNNIGNVYKALSDYDNALLHYEKSFDLHVQTQDRIGQAITQGNIGVVSENQGDYPKALRFYHKSLTLCTEIGNQYGQALAFENMGSVYATIGDTAAAYECHQKSLTIRQAIGDRFGETASWHSLAVLSLKMLDTAEARQHCLDCLNKAVAIAQDIHAPALLADIHQAFAEVYKRQGDFQKALNHHETFTRLKQKAFDEDSDRKLKNLQVLYQLEQAKKETEIARLKTTEIAVALAEAETQRQLAANANALKSELLSVVAHDLKNPLSAIQGFSQLILDNILDPAAIEEAATVIHKSTTRVLDIISGLLESAALESGTVKLNLQHLKVSELVISVASSMQSQAERKGQQLHTEIEPCYATIDVPSIERILENLIGNAIKYSMAGKQIWVRTKTLAAGGVRIEVQDEGQGLTEADQRKLFKKFQRLSATPTGGENATGLGLSIVKQLVELHGGKIWAESDGKNKGTTFIIELPK